MASFKQKQRAFRYGLWSEKIAVWYLRAKGYRIFAQRYRNAYGEIDIVAGKGEMLIAVEVKARKTLEACVESIPAYKQQKIARAMSGLIASPLNLSMGLANIHERTIRFDVIWITPKRWPVHMKDAWRM